MSNYGKDPVFPNAYKDGEYWFVEINNLEQLLSQIGQNKDPNWEKNCAFETQRLVIGGNHWRTRIPELIVYDDYLE